MLLKNNPIETISLSFGIKEDYKSFEPEKNLIQTIISFNTLKDARISLNNINGDIIKKIKGENESIKTLWINRLSLKNNCSLINLLKKL